MKHLLLFPLLLAVFAGFGQGKTLDAQSDTAFWFAQRQTDAARLKLSDLMQSSDSLHFRYWMNDQAIEIWTRDYATFSGLIVSFAEKVDLGPGEDAKNKVAKYYSKKVFLTPGEAKAVMYLFNKSHFFEIPSDRKVKGWTVGLDGDEFEVEYATKTSYSFKVYWAPSAHPGLPEADTIMRVNEALRTQLNLEGRWNQFYYGLAGGCYWVGGVSEVCSVSRKRKKKHTH